MNIVDKLAAIGWHCAIPNLNPIGAMVGDAINATSLCGESK